MERFILLGLLVLLFLEAGLCQVDITYITEITIEDGLSSNNVKDIVQDKNGTMWIATQNGLNLYDGKNFKIFKYDENDSTSISANGIQVLCITSDGNLWIGTSTAGLCKYDGQGSFKRFRHNPLDPRSISSDQIWSLKEDSKGNLWVGTQDGLSLLNKETNDFTRFTHAPNDVEHSISKGGVLSILEDSKGYLWAGVWGGGVSLVKPKKDLNGKIIDATFLNINSIPENS